MSYTRETIGWRKEAHELSGQADTALIHGWRGIRISVAEKIVVAAPVGGTAVFDRDIVCARAAFLRCAVDVPALVFLQLHWRLRLPKNHSRGGL